MIANPFSAGKIFLLLFVALSSCKKLKEDPIVKITYHQIASDGLQLKATIHSGEKNVSEAGFCFGTSSNPEADLNSSVQLNTIVVNLDGKNFSTVIPDYYFNSYTGYYIRPFVKKDQKITYGSEIYYDKIQQESVTSTCSPADNFFNPGNSVVPGAQTFYNVNVSYGGLSEYRVEAFSNNHNVKLEFAMKPKTGIYYSSSYANVQEKLVNISLNVGSLSKAPVQGHPVYVNEYEAGKFEITFCEMPWQFSSSNTQYATSRIITE